MIDNDFAVWLGTIFYDGDLPLNVQEAIAKALASEDDPC